MFQRVSTFADLRPGKPASAHFSLKLTINVIHTGGHLVPEIGCEVAVTVRHYLPRRRHHRRLYTVRQIREGIP